jgi:hypothetical protein
MSAKTKKILVLICASLLILICFLVFLRKTEKQDNVDRVEISKSQPFVQIAPKPQMNESSDAIVPDEPIHENIELRELSQKDRVKLVFESNIDFYGKVLDQQGDPVERAKIKIAAADGYWENGSDFFEISDTNGLFSIKGIKGAGIYVSVEKSGYHRTEKSKGRFGYGMKSGENPHDKHDHPAIFLLQKKGAIEPLFCATHKDRAEYFQRGQKIALDLKNGQRRSGNASIEITSINNRLEGQDRDYTWRFIVTVPGGEIIERNDPLQFLAPENGYQSQAMIGYDAKAEDWRSRQEKDFFVRFANGTYGRVKLDAWSKTKNGFFFESYVNPSGSKYLEYDPSKSLSRK